MIDLIKLDGLKGQRPSALLGLALDGSRLDAVVLRRTNGSLQVQQSASITLSLDPLTSDSELVGREIRNHLDAAGGRERRCVVGVPLKWALTTQVELPQLPEQDVEGFLQLEAERGFHCDAQTLLVVRSLCRSPSGKQHATLVGIPKNHLALLEAALRAAKLKPVSFSLGIGALQSPGAQVSDGVLALAIGESHVALQVTCGGGVAALRMLEGALEIQGGRRVLHADLVAREARITLGQLPAELREAVHRVRVFGPRDLAQQLADEIELRLEPMGLKLDVVGRYSADEFGLQIPAGAAVSTAFSLAAKRLAGRKELFEFLPPRLTAWQQVARRYPSGKLGLTGAVAGSAALLVAGLFFFQQWQLSRWGSQWSAMAPKVTQLQKVQDQIRHFRPWFDESLRGLTILRQITAAFPENGVVSAKSVEIRELSAVTCTGVATDYQALVKTLAKLNSTPGISGLKLDRVSGKAPMQFTFDFHWSEGGKSEN